MKRTLSKTNTRREALAKAARKRTMTRALRAEQLEERIVMDAYATAASYYGSVSLKAKGDDARWIGNNSNTGPSTLTTTSPVEVSRVKIGAPDGGRLSTFQQVGDNYPSSTFTPANGLLTVENGQTSRLYYRVDGSIGVLPIVDAQQQEINVQQDLFPANVVTDPGVHSLTEFRTSFTVPTTGQYSFYITHWGSGGIKIGDQFVRWDTRTDPTKLTVQLTAGSSIPLTLNYNHSGYSDIDQLLKVEWEGPGITRQSFVPDNDIVYKHNYGFGRSEPVASGIISPAAIFSAEKRLRDDNYGLRYKTTFTIPATGEYTFFLASDNRAELKLGSDVVVTKDFTESSGKRTFTAGTVLNLELNYMHTTGSRSLKFEWAGPGLSRQLFKSPNLVTYEYFEGNYFSIDDFRRATPVYSGSAFSDPKLFVIEWNGQRTAPIQVGASAEAVRSAIESLSNVGAVGGSVTVTRAANGLKYNVTFGGSTWFRPKLMSVLGRSSATVKPLTTVAVTKRDSNSTLSLSNLSRTFSATLSNPNTFPIDNAPMFTPETLSYTDAYREANSIALGLVMSGYLQSPAVGGRFDPNYASIGASSGYNVVRTETGLRVASPRANSAELQYRLNALKDSTGSSRPITLFTMGGLQFEATAGSKAKLIFQKSDNELIFQSIDTSLLVSAPFEGGRLNLRLIADASPVYRINLATGKVDITPKFEFVSFEIGGFVIPPSESFKMSYDAASQKFSAQIDGLVVESPHPDGTPNAYEVNDQFKTAVQTFETRYSIANASYSYVYGYYPNTTTESFRNDILAKSGKTGPQYTSDMLSVPKEVMRNGFVDNFGAVYRWTINVNKTGLYTFRSMGNGPQELRVNNNSFLLGSEGRVEKTIQLTAGVDYSFEYTQVSIGRLQQYSFDLQFSGPSTDGFVRINTTSQGEINGISSPNSESWKLSSATLDNVKNAFNTAIDRQAGLTDAQRKQIKDAARITVEPNRISITNIPYLIKITGQWYNSSQQRYSNPVKLTIPSGTFSITKGKLDPITDLTIDSFEVGATTINSFFKFSTTYEPIRPSQAGGFKAHFFQRNVYDSDGSVSIPGNTFGIYGNESRLPLNVAGVRLEGVADLGSAAAPGLIVTNGQFIKLTYPIPLVTVDGMIFTATSVGSARPLTVNYYPPIGNAEKSYVVQGGAVLKTGSTLIQSELKANFGGLGSDGLRIFPSQNGNPASFTLSFGVVGAFLAGTQAIESVQSNNGLKLVYDPIKKNYNFQGDAFLDFNPTTPHTATSLAFTGSKLEVTATIPAGATGMQPNLLNGTTLNFYFSDRASINGFQIAPRSSSNPLRVTIAKEGDIIGGSFTLRLGNSFLYGVMEESGFNGTKMPADGFNLDMTTVAGQSADFSLAGIQLTGSGKTVLTDNLVLNFEKATFQGTELASGNAGSEPVVIEAKNGKIIRGEINRSTLTQLGDVTFNTLKATFVASTAAAYWSFKGSGKYFGKNVEVGSPGAGNPQIKIGGDPKKGYQLSTINEPAPLITPDFKLPETIDIAGLKFDTSLLPQDAPVLDEGALGKTFSLKSADYKVKLGNTVLTLSLNAKVKVSPGGVDVVSFSATGVQNSAFTIGNAKFQVQTLTAEYNLAEKKLNISGKAKFTFKASKANVDMTVTLGTTKDPGLVIADGAVKSLKITVDGTFDLLKLSVAAESLTVAYHNENNEFAIYGGVKISTAEQAGVQVIKDLAVTLGSEDKPGIKIVDGSLHSLDITINGEINLFKLTATPKDLHIAYSAEDNQLQIDGALSVTLAPKLTITAELPGDGLLIDTDTGKVQVKGLSLKAEGDLKFGAMTIKGLHIDYEEADNGDVTIGAGAEIQLPSGLGVGGSFKIINGKLDSIGIIFEKNPGILVANGVVNIYRLDVLVEGLSDLDNFKFKGSIKASVGPLVKFAGQSYALADVTGTVEITTRYLKLSGDVQLVGGQLGNGFFEGTLLWNPPPSDPNQLPRVTFEAEVKLFKGDIVRGKIKAYADIRGNVDFNADMGVFVPAGVPLAGGSSLGQLYVELRVRPALEPSASYVKFGFSDIAITAVRIPTFHGNIRVGFDSKVDYGFGARFFIPLPWPLPDIDFSLDFNGSFQLRDSQRPFIEILAAAALDGTPDGEILFSATTPIPAGTIIDLYADRDNLGNDGLLIASNLQYHEGSQRYVWENMAAFAKPGQPIYVYAVINDQRHAPEFSNYSTQFNVAPGFTPTILSPATVSFNAGETVTFSEALGNRIVIGDPRANTKPDSQVEVTLSVGGGTIDLAHAPEDVLYRGAGTGLLTIRGTAANITRALDGLFYTQRSASDTNDTLDISVISLPLLNQSGATKAHIDLRPNAVGLSLIAATDVDQPITITVGSEEELPLAYLQIDTLHSEQVIGAKVEIVGYEAGKDVLLLALADEVVSGIQSTFDADTGVLTLSGFDWTEDFEYALQNVAFVTSSMTGGKSLKVSVSDDNGDIGDLIVPLVIVPGHDAPRLELSSLGTVYTSTSGNIRLDAEANLDIADGSQVRSITVSFIKDSYVAGEDLLSYVGTTIHGTFDAELGSLLLTGSGTENDWLTALHNIRFQSIGSTFTVGARYLEITVTDDALENNSDSTLFVIQKSTSLESGTSIDLVLPSASVTLPPHEDVIYIAEGLTVAADQSLLLGATVSISQNYIAGEDELQVTSLWEGMDAEFDTLTGVLTITGVATAFEYEDVLRSIVFINSAGFRTPGDVEISYALLDGLSPVETDSLLLTIESAPYATGAIDNVLNYEQGRELEMIGENIDIDFNSSITSATVSFEDGFHADQDVLTFVDQASIQGSFDSATGVLTLTGNASVQQYEAALASVGYRNTRYNPVAGDRIVYFQVKSQTAASNAVPVLISVEPDVVPPQVTVGPANAFRENGGPVAIAPALSIAPMDATSPFLSAPEDLFGAEIDIVNYVPGEDVLAFQGIDSVTGEFDAEQGRLTFYGQASFDEYEALLRSVVYSNTSDVPTTTARQFRIRLLDSGANGMDNQTFTTQVVIGEVDEVTLVTGTADDIHLLQNDSAISLGLDDLQFSSSAVGEFSVGVELRFVASQLPASSLGQVVLADGTAVELNTSYSMDQLAGLRFEPSFGATGVAEFSYRVVVADTDSGNFETSGFSDSIMITLEGVTTKSPLEAFIAQAYRDLLDRNPEPNTLTSLASSLADKLERVGRSKGFASEAEARESLLAELLSNVAIRTEQISAIYQSLLGRAPTSSEVAGESSALTGTRTLDDLKLDLLASGEFFELHNDAGYSSYVDALYQTLYERQPTENELASGVTRLQSGQALAVFVNAIGNWSNLSEADQHQWISRLLDRDYDFDDQFDFDFSSRQSLLISIIASEEYFLRSSTPTSTDFIPTQVTNGYSAVGILGDIGGGKAGGTLIAPQYVLVAAHSVLGVPKGQLTFEIGGVVHRIEQVIVHPDFNSDLLGGDGGNDIALLKLDSAVTDIEPAQLTGRSPRLGEPLILVGFGEDGGERFGTKRVGTTPQVDQVERTVFYWTQTTPDQNDSDAGDSGSPLFVRGNETDLLIGIVMGGTSVPGGVGSIATNTRIDAYLSWIQSIVPSLQVSDANDPPSLQLDDLALFLDENSGPHLVGFEVSANDAVTFSVETDNPTLINNLSVDYGGLGLGDVVFETAINARGTAIIVVTAFAASLSTTQTITVTVEERNDPPTIDAIGTQVIDKNAGAQSILLSGLSAGLGETGAVLVNVAGVLPNDFFVSIGISPALSSSSVSILSTSDKQLNYTVRDGAIGSGYITLQLRDAGPDGQFNTDDDETVFQEIEVRVANTKAPTLATINAQQFLLSAGQQSIPLSGIGDGDDGTQQLRFEVLSSDMDVANAYVLYAGDQQPTTGNLIVVPNKVGSTVLSVRVTDPGDDGIFDTTDDRVTTRTLDLDITAALNYWHNFSDPLDVNDDGLVTPVDLLLIVDHINNSNSTGLPDRSAPVAPYLDTDNNGLCAPLDALRVINRLNSQQTLSALASGEASIATEMLGDAISQLAKSADTRIPKAEDSTQESTSASTQNDWAIYDLFSQDEQVWTENHRVSKSRGYASSKR